MTEAQPAHAGVHFPPPLLFVVPFALGMFLQRWHGLTIVPPAIPSLVRAVEVAGVVLMLAWALGTATAFGKFLRARTSILPFRPSSSLVTSGPYRFTRNPMYVSMAALYMGGALALNALWPLLLLPLVLVVVDRAVIRREERYLTRAFGKEYDAYRSRVRRWL